MVQDPGPTRLCIDLFGGMTASFDDGRPLSLPTRKSRALLAYLAVPAGRFHPRERLTALLWGNTTDIRARQSFRQALASLRRAAGPIGSRLILSQGDTTALDPDLVTVDVARLQAALADGGLDGLHEASALWRGEFLDGFQVEEPPFEEWCAEQRDTLRGLALNAMSRVLRSQTDAGAAEDAIRTAQRIVAIDPSQEAAHRALMRLYLAEGRRAAAINQYHVCVDWLDRELDATPEDATLALYREMLRAGGAAPRNVGALPAALLAPDRQRESAPLTGRETELQFLRDQLTSMLDRGGRAALVRGEAGIGKSRLIREFAAEAAGRGTRLALGRCHETEQILPLRLWVDTLRGDTGSLDPGLRDRLDGATITLLAQVFPELLAAGERASAPPEQFGPLFDALVALIEAQAQDRPIVVVLEDLQWADALSVRFLAFLGRRLERLPVLVLCSMRPEDIVDAPLVDRAVAELKSESRLDEMLLAPLTEADTNRLLQALLPPETVGAAWRGIADRIWTLSDGNPFVIGESARALRDRSPEEWLNVSGVARSVIDFVSGRLDRLPERQRRAVSVAATIGREFSFALLIRASGMTDAEGAEALEDLVQRGILVLNGDRLDVSHARIRSVAYDRLLPQRRALLHAAVGEALEAIHADNLDAVADQLGHHFTRAGDASRAIAWLTRFAGLAARTYALDDALRALTQAMAAVRALPAGEQHRWTLDLVLRQAFILSSLGRTLEVRDLLRTHADLATRVDDPALASEYHFRVALTCVYLGDKVLGRQAAERALTDAERTGAAEAIGKALYVRSLNDYESGRPKDGIAGATRAIALLSDLPGARIWLGLAYWDLALNCLVSGDLDAALDAAAQCDAIGEAAGWPRVRALAGHVAAWAHATRGDCDLAIEAARRGLDHSRDPATQAMVSGALGLAYLERGDSAAAIAVLEPVVEQLRTSPVRSSEARHMALLGEAYLLAGNLCRGETTAGRALEISQSEAMMFNIGLARRALGRVAMAEGKLAAAEDHLTASVDAFTACDAGFEAARTHLDLARLPGDSRTRPHLTAAIAVFKAANAPRQLAAADALWQGLATAQG